MADPEKTDSTATTPTTKKKPGAGTAGILMLLIVLMLASAWFCRPGWNYVAVMVFMLLLMVAIGVGINGRFLGILINERNLMSLSRFQLVLWTLIILSAYLTSALGRLHDGNIADALAIGLDEKLWALMGISTASLVGTSLIHSTKTDKEPDAKVMAKASVAVDDKKMEQNKQGLLYANPTIQDASFSDMFEGDEIGNTAYVDLGKVQMFVFTIVAALSYGLDLFKWIGTKQFIPADPAAQVAFPLISGGLIAILGISHGGYLVSKSTDHTPTEPPS